jgi:erythromycin esterase
MPKPDTQIEDAGRRTFLATTTALAAVALTADAASALSGSSAGYASLDEWIAREAIPFSSDKDFNAAVDKMMARLGDQVSILGLGETLHGGDQFLTLRNRLFKRLVEAHGFSAITLETNMQNARLVDSYVAGRGPAAYEAVQDQGFSYGSGKYAANRELVEWMRAYNADPDRKSKVSFYGTVPSEQETTESPRALLEFALAYLASVDPAAGARHKAIIEPLLGANADWEDSARVIHKEILTKIVGADIAQHIVGGDPQSKNPGTFGLSQRAGELRVATDELGRELNVRRPEYVAKSSRDAYGEAVQHLNGAKNLLALHAALARREPVGELVSMRDAMAADYLAYVSEREKPRGKVLVYLHIAHLRRTWTKLPWYEFWPTGAHLDQLFGSRFALIGGALGTSEANFIGAPEAGTIEARLLAHQKDCFIPVHRGKGLYRGAPPPVRSGPTKPNIPYEVLTPESVADLDMLVFLRTATYTRGAAPIPG